MSKKKNDNKLTELEKKLLKELEQENFDKIHPEWKPIVINGVEVEYKINNCGEVWSNRSNKILKLSKNPDGYLHAAIITKDRQYKIGVHRLVAIAFIPNPDNKPQVNHKDGDKTRNWYRNLEWMTQQENIQHAIDNGLRDSFLGVNSPKNVYPEETIHKICKLLESGKTQSEIAKELDVNKGTVNGIKRKKMWKHISCKYNIPEPISRPNPRPVGLRLKVIEMINNGISNEDILSKLDLPDNRVNRKYIAVIKSELKSKVESSTTIENAKSVE